MFQCKRGRICLPPCKSDFR
ncbi:hypothetical protein D1151_16035 [Emergencia sp. 1XD21-10]|nr:hypothetical protein [Emergencia sp. 1XD21-10]